jgi:hypothetical protein
VYSDAAAPRVTGPVTSQPSADPVSSPASSSDAEPATCDGRMVPQLLRPSAWVRVLRLITPPPQSFAGTPRGAPVSRPHASHAPRDLLVGWVRRGLCADAAAVRGCGSQPCPKGPAPAGGEPPIPTPGNPGEGGGGSHRGGTAGAWWRTLPGPARCAGRSAVRCRGETLRAALAATRRGECSAARGTLHVHPTGGGWGALGPGSGATKVAWAERGVAGQGEAVEDAGRSGSGDRPGESMTRQAGGEG